MLQVQFYLKLKGGVYSVKKIQKQVQVERPVERRNSILLTGKMEWYLNITIFWAQLAGSPSRSLTYRHQSPMITLRKN